MNSRSITIQQAVERITQRVFEAPSRLTHEQRAERVAAIATAIHHAIPTYANAEQVRDQCDRGIRDLSLAAKSAAWPLPSAVLEAFRPHAAAAPRRADTASVRGDARDRASEPYDAETIEVATRLADAVNAGRPVGQRESYDWAWLAAARRGLITADAVLAWQRAVGLSTHPLSTGARDTLGWPIGPEPTDTAVEA